MLPPARILVLCLRWLALACGVLVAASGAAAFLQVGKGIGATPTLILFVAAILFWCAGGIIDYRITRHARRRLRAMLAMMRIQEDSLPDAFPEQKEFRPGDTLRITQLAAAPTRTAE